MGNGHGSHARPAFWCWLTRAPALAHPVTSPRFVVVSLLAIARFGRKSLGLRLIQELIFAHELPRRCASSLCRTSPSNHARTSLLVGPSAVRLHVKPLSAGRPARTMIRCSVFSSKGPPTLVLSDDDDDARTFDGRRAYSQRLLYRTRRPYRAEIDTDRCAVRQYTRKSATNGRSQQGDRAREATRGEGDEASVSSSFIPSSTAHVHRHGLW